MVQHNSSYSVSLIATHSISGVLSILLTNLCRPGDLVKSDRGIEMQTRVWKEIVDSLATKVPEVAQLASMPA